MHRTTDMATYEEMLKHVQEDERHGAFHPATDKTCGFEYRWRGGLERLNGWWQPAFQHELPYDSDEWDLTEPF